MKPWIGILIRFISAWLIFCFTCESQAQLCVDDFTNWPSEVRYLPPTEADSNAYLEFYPETVGWMNPDSALVLLNGNQITIQAQWIAPCFVGTPPGPRLHRLPVARMGNGSYQLAGNVSPWNGSIGPGNFTATVLVGSGVPDEIPTTNRFGLGVLMLLALGLGWLMLRPGNR